MGLWGKHRFKLSKRRKSLVPEIRRRGFVLLTSKISEAVKKGLLLLEKSTKAARNNEFKKRLTYLEKCPRAHLSSTKSIGPALVFSFYPTIVGGEGEGGSKLFCGSKKCRSAPRKPDQKGILFSPLPQPTLLPRYIREIPVFLSGSENQVLPHP